MSEPPLDRPPDTGTPSEGSADAATDSFAGGELPPAPADFLFLVDRSESSPSPPRTTTGRLPAIGQQLVVMSAAANVARGESKRV